MQSLFYVSLKSNFANFCVWYRVTWLFINFDTHLVEYNLHFTIITYRVLLLLKKPNLKFCFNFEFQHVLADSWVVRSSDLGRDSNTIHVRTHLGAILKPGDSVMGLDLSNSNVNDANFEKLTMSGQELPEVVLVRKHYGDSNRRRRKRKWKLKRVAADMNDAG